MLVPGKLSPLIHASGVIDPAEATDRDIISWQGARIRELETEKATWKIAEYAMGNAVVHLAKQLNERRGMPMEYPVTMVKADIERFKRIGAFAVYEQNADGDLTVKVSFRAPDHGPARG